MMEPQHPPDESPGGLARQEFHHPDDLIRSVSDRTVWSNRATTLGAVDLETLPDGVERIELGLFSTRLLFQFAALCRATCVDHPELRLTLYRNEEHTELVATDPDTDSSVGISFPARIPREDRA